MNVPIEIPDGGEPGSISWWFHREWPRDKLTTSVPVGQSKSMDFQWNLHGLPMDCPRILHGLNMVLLVSRDNSCLMQGWESEC